MVLFRKIALDTRWRADYEMEEKGDRQRQRAAVGTQVGDG